MNSIIITPKNAILKHHIQYFLFFRKKFSQNLNYTTFPNSNLCLSIYKDNSINYNYSNGANHCVIDKGDEGFVSKLYGFHNKPFRVDLNSSLDQICILFNPCSLRAFTKVPYNAFLSCNSVFQEIFGIESNYQIEQIFEIDDLELRAEILEKILIKGLKNDIPTKLQEAISLISNANISSISIETLKNKLQLSESTLFRLFTNHLGQNPKSFLRTIRFRKSLNDVINSEQSLTNIAYANQFYDQAHFIKDFKVFTENTPNQLINKLSIRRDKLTWICNENYSE